MTDEEAAIQITREVLMHNIDIGTHSAADLATRIVSALVEVEIISDEVC